MNDIERPAVSYHPKADEICQTRQYQLITPLFGGGVAPNCADPISVVRASEVRGHLRFWWRATQLGRFSSLEELKNAEDSLWGSTETPSEVKMMIREVAFKEQIYAYKVKREPHKKPTAIPSAKIAPYAAFPLQPDKDQLNNIEWRSAKVLLKVSFDLVIRFPKGSKNEIEDSLWAWETFGGIGARTRRGFGALCCKAINGDEVEKPDRNKIKEWLKLNLNEHVYITKEPIIGIPFLSCEINKYETFETNRDPISCWKDTIETLQKFRQDDARYGDKYGLSLWPEANAIRHLLGLDPRFPDNGKERKQINRFPRAKFGLPINFHMSHDEIRTKEIILQGKKNVDETWINRMASPLILRPIACVNGSVGIAALLQWRQNESDEPYTPCGGLQLKGVPDDPKVKSDLTLEDVSEIPMLNNSDVLKEFLVFFKNNGGKRHER